MSFWLTFENNNFSCGIKRLLEAYKKELFVEPYEIDIVHTKKRQSGTLL